MGDLVLFNISHYGRLAHMIAYSMTHHRDDRCILLIDTGWLSQETDEFVKSLTSIPSFENFYLYDEGEIGSNHGGKTVDSVVEYFDNLMDRVGIDIKDFKKVYTGFDTIHAFGLYLAVKDVKYAISDGPFSSSTDGSHVFERSEYHALLDEYKAMTWNSPRVEKVIYTMGNSFEEIMRKMEENNHPSKGRSPAEGKDIEFFPLETAFSQMTDEEKQSIFDFFRIPQFDGRECVLLLLTSSFFLTDKYVETYDSTMTWEEMYLQPYRLLLDRIPLGDRQLIIKAHPNTRISPVALKVLFPGVAYIPGYVPSDILKFVDMNIGLGISPGSNSISTMSIEKSFTLPRSYFLYLDMFREIPFLLDITKKIGCKGLDFGEYLPEELTEGLEELFSSNLSAGLLSLRVFPSLKKYGSYKGPCMVRIGGLADIPEEGLPAGQVFEVSWDLVEHSGIYNPGPVYYLLTGDREQMYDYSFRSYGKYSSAIMGVKWVSPYNVAWAKKRPVSDDLLVERAKDGNTYSQAKLANLLYKGDDGRTKDVKQAIFWMKQATEDDRSVKHRKGLVKMMWNESDDQEYMVELIKKIPDEGFRNFYLGRAYRVGKGVPKDFGKALEMLRVANSLGVKGSTKELFDTLWKIDTPETDAEMFTLVKSGIEDDEATTMARFGKMYLYGRGVEKDIDQAVKCLREAMSLEANCLRDLFDALWALGTPEADKEMVELVKPLADKGDGEAMALYSRLLRDGRGVGCDLAAAKDFLKKASGKGVKWAKKELAGME